jgi:hypothetical protein
MGDSRDASFPMGSNPNPLYGLLNGFPQFFQPPYPPSHWQITGADGNPPFRPFQAGPGHDEQITISDESSEDETSSFEADSEDGLDVLRPSLHALGLSTHYVPSWRGQDAFREFYQNW